MPRFIRTTLLLTLGLLLLVAGWGHAATVTQSQSGTEDTWITNSTNVVNNAQVLSGAVTVTSAGYLYAYCTLNAPSWSGTVTAGTSITTWFLTSTSGGATYEDGDASTTPARVPDMIFPLRNVSTAQVVGAYVSRMPVGTFKILVRNDGTGVTLQGATTAWTIKCKPHTLVVN